MTEYRVRIPRENYYDAVSWLNFNNWVYYSIPGPPWAMWDEKDAPIGFIFPDKDHSLLFALRWA